MSAIIGSIIGAVLGFISSFGFIAMNPLVHLTLVHLNIYFTHYRRAPAHWDILYPSVNFSVFASYNNIMMLKLYE